MAFQHPLITKADFKSPGVIIFAAVYLAAAVMSFLQSPATALAYIGMSVGIAFLLWFVAYLTDPTAGGEVRLKFPLPELAFAALVYYSSRFVPLPRLAFGQQWALPSIIRNLLLDLLVPLLFLRLLGYNLKSMGLSTENLKRNVRIGLIAFACMALPSAFLIAGTGSDLLQGRLRPLHAVPGFFVLFGQNVFLAGLPEEFFYRSFVQTRICNLLRSTAGGILVTATLFGLIHITPLRTWYPGMTLGEAFTRGFFIQGITSLVQGTLWARTRSLVPGIMVHSGINALNNLGSVTELIFR